jgi:leader peptidase (prepilin peptidase)/N-methyltransferase
MSGPDALLDAFAFASGAAFGSFANVCVHRLPLGESIVSPPSRCPSCGTRIAARDNVPILGWLLLRGRCRACRAPISPRYPLVELVVAVLFLAAFLRYGATSEAVAAALLSAASVILVSTDLEARILPDEVTLGTMVLGLVLAATSDVAAHRPIRWGESDLLESAAGAALGAGLLLGIGGVYRGVRGGEGVGLGDVKMIAMIGALTGPAGVLLSLFFGSLSGALLGGALLASRALSWGRARALAHSGDLSGAARAGAGLAVSPEGRIVATGARWSEIPGASSAAEPPALARPVGRPLLALLRLGARRARRGVVTSTGRLVLEDETFFRVLAARVESVRGATLLLLARADIPFGVFLALGSVTAFVIGRAALSWLFGDLPIPAARLLP